MDEGVLRRVIGGPEVMRDQLRFLYEISQHPKIQIQVIPYSVGYHVGLGGSLTILGFHDDLSMAYAEVAGIGFVVEQPSEVAAVTVRYDLLRGHALSVEESRAMIQEGMECYERQGDQVAQGQP